MADEKKKTNKKRRDHRESKQQNGGGGKLRRNRDHLTPVQKVLMGYPLAKRGGLKYDKGARKASTLAEQFAKVR